MKIFIISDIHLGIRNNKMEWIDNMSDYFYKFFIPLLKERYQEGDVLFILGDYYDNRQSLQLAVLDKGIQVMEDLASILPVHLILGNHDCHTRENNKINSCKIFKYIPNVHVYEEPENITIGGKNMLMMPWRVNTAAEQHCINAHRGDYLFCHTSILGMKFNASVDIEEGLEMNTLRSFKRVYTGHIHYRQERDNIRIVGAPYQMDRADIGNTKGVYILDPINDVEEFIPNTFSPQFLRVEYKDIEANPALKDILKNNYVDLVIREDNMLSSSYQDLAKELSDCKKLDFVFKSEEVDEVNVAEINLNSTIQEYGILNLFKTYTDALDEKKYNDDKKTKLYKALEFIYKKVKSE